MSRTASYLWLAIPAYLATGCGPVAGGPLNPDGPTLKLTGPGPFTVSNPVTVGAEGGSFAPQDGATPTKVFVSLARGTLAQEAEVRVRILGSATATVRPTIDGGMDPIGITATATDTLALTIVTPGPAVTTFTFMAPRQRPPTLVRTQPSRNGSDVASNLRAAVVFSEPVDPASVTPGSVLLQAGSTRVTGQIATSPDGITIEFIPDTALLPATGYDLVIRSDILDLDGQALGADITIPFQTGALLPDMQIAFVRDGQIHLANADGTVRLTDTEPGTRNADPAWSPDGRRIAFASNRGGRWDIYVMEADGSNVRQRTRTGGSYEPTWSADGRWLAFSGSGSIMAVEADGDQTRVLVDYPGWEGQPAWSPDGTRLTFTTDYNAYDFVFDLFEADADGTNPRPPLSHPLTTNNEGLRFYHNATWSPDGRMIAILVCGYNRSNCTPDPQNQRTSQVSVANADGSDLRPLAEAGLMTRLSWSPDGTEIAYASRTCGTCPIDVRVVPTDGRAGRLLLTNGHSPSWRPMGPGPLPGPSKPD